YWACVNCDLDDSNYALIILADTVKYAQPDTTALLIWNCTGLIADPEYYRSMPRVNGAYVYVENRLHLRRMNNSYKKKKINGEHYYVIKPSKKIHVELYTDLRNELYGKSYAQQGGKIEIHEVLLKIKIKANRIDSLSTCPYSLPLKNIPIDY